MVEYVTTERKSKEEAVSKRRRKRRKLYIFVAFVSGTGQSTVKQNRKEKKRKTENSIGTNRLNEIETLCAQEIQKLLKENTG